VIDETAESGSFKLDAGLVIHDVLLRSVCAFDIGRIVPTCKTAFSRWWRCRQAI